MVTLPGTGGIHYEKAARIGVGGAFVACPGPAAAAAYALWPGRPNNEMRVGILFVRIVE